MYANNIDLLMLAVTGGKERTLASLGDVEKIPLITRKSLSDSYRIFDIGSEKIKKLISRDEQCQISLIVFRNRI